MTPQQHLVTIRLALKAAADDGVRIFYSEEGGGSCMSSDCHHNLTQSGSLLMADEDPDSLKNIMAKYKKG